MEKCTSFQRHYAQLQEEFRKMQAPADLSDPESSPSTPDNSTESSDTDDTTCSQRRKPSLSGADSSCTSSSRTEAGIQVVASSVGQQADIGSINGMINGEIEQQHHCSSGTVDQPVGPPDSRHSHPSTSSAPALGATAEPASTSTDCTHPAGEQAEACATVMHSGNAQLPDLVNDLHCMLEEPLVNDANHENMQIYEELPGDGVSGAQLPVAAAAQSQLLVTGASDDACGQLASGKSTSTSEVCDISLSNTNQQVDDCLMAESLSDSSR